MNKMILTSLIFVISILGSSGQDRFFARTYTSNVLPKGNVDIEFWHTSRFGHKDQFFHAQDQRMELEFGLGGKVQTAIYFNRYQKRFSTTSEGTTTSTEIGYSNEWKWKLTDPSLHPVGFALYGEWGIKGGDEAELETKIILDKYVGNNLLAFNGVLELEKEFEWEDGRAKGGETEKSLELDLAYMYNINSKIGVGVELTDFNKFEDGWRYSALFGGPTFNYRTSRWFIIVNYLPQWGNLHKTDIEPGNKVLDDHERTEARILIGISL